MSRSNGRRRVVITGSGVIAPLGNSVAEFWRNAVAGGSGIRRLTQVDPSEYACQIAGEVRDFNPECYLDRKDARRMARFAQFAVAASKQAVEEAALDFAAQDTTRIGVIVGNGGGGLPEADRAMRTLLRRGGSRVDPLFIPKMLPNMASANVSIQLGARGYSNTITTACAAGTQAIGDATEVLRRGAADVMIAGGTEAGVCEVGLAGFSAMRALATSSNECPEAASRPFDRDRDGFVAAEGAGIVVLEALDHALARGARPLAEVVGYGVSSDAAYLVAPPRDGEGAARAMRSALSDAAMAVEEIDYISAHATATEIGDVAETRAVRAVFGKRAYRLPISAMKSQIGHLLGAAGGVETVAAVQTIRTGMIAPTINLTHPDPECDLDYVPQLARAADVRTVMKNSFGFGGQNAVLVLTAFSG